MKHTNSELAMSIIHCIEDIEDHPGADISGEACTRYLMKLTKGKPLSTLPERTLRHVLNLYHNILGR